MKNVDKLVRRLTVKSVKSQLTTLKFLNTATRQQIPETREPIERIKAYTWSDVLNFVKNKYFQENSDLNINCEKDFAYIEKKALRDVSSSNMNSIIDKLGYRIFLNKNIPTELDDSSSPGKFITDIT